MCDMTVGIVGCGFVGGALKQWLEEHNPAVTIRVSDPAKGYHDAMDGADAVFVSIHIPTEEDGTQDVTPLSEIIAALPDVPVFVRTTILPGTSERLSAQTGRRVHFMPEFLTERTAYADFSSQPMVFTAETALLQRIFVGKKFVEMTSLEAEIAKYAHNVFGAVKVTYFNGVHELCQRLGANYANIRHGVLLSGYINPTHTNVPGPDGRFGYGGKCFPKDVNAFTEICAGTKLHDLLRHVAPLNTHYRNE
ncbi:MAG: UDP-glucose 6-dehydrogenase [Kiritimatiellaeota bacterium]|nr:UDP-glucose 6-dehydrogenase [Kiritimatiellota bacterium]